MMNDEVVNKARWLHSHRCSAITVTVRYPPICNGMAIYRFIDPLGRSLEVDDVDPIVQHQVEAALAQLRAEQGT